ncbi:hypothetical protein B296_00024922 [Ensete ventricosum]|uniref:Pre-mRNA-splicing factor 38 C-terminal domain-containing protein n=1 Tax=Ensete ventricosum TaxID=4639 RepID=A0A426YCA3_ENSVE|nr:hypothetical protein B296_00024922 [Ensete ventricosum]
MFVGIMMQYYFDTLFPRVPVPVMRQIVANLEKLNLPTKHCGVTGETSRQGSDDIARRPPSVKAALSVSFGQRAPHRASTRDSSPVRRNLGPMHERSDGGDHRRSSPSIRRSSSRDRHDRDHDRDHHDRDRRDHYRDRDHSERDRGRDSERRQEHEWRGDRDRDSQRSRHSERDSGRRDHERSGRDADEYRHSSLRRSRSRSRSRSHSIIHIHHGPDSDHRPSPFRDENKEKTKAVSSNLAKLKDLYGDVSDKKSNEAADRLPKDSSTEEVIRLGGSTWR